MTERTRLARGEPPLSVFVSSLMSPELLASRQAAFDQLAGRGFAPWVFEFTPASELGAVDTYLAKVRDCDVFVWIVKDRTTEPVANEVQEALRTERRLIVLLLPTAERDERSLELIKLVGQRAKWQEVAKEEELAHALGAALDDLAARALRTRPEPGLQDVLDRLSRASRARCRRRWLAVGVEPATAKRLADDETVGAKLEEPANGEVVVLLGDVGAGKSLAAERLHQRTIDRLQHDRSAALPAFMSASEARGGLRDAVYEATRQLGDLQQAGARVVVDGLDEAGIDVALLLDEARELVAALPDSWVVLTSRPLPVLAESPERKVLTGLTIEAAEEVAALAGMPPGRQMSGLPEAVAEAARKPLFALLYGSYAARNAGAIATTAQLIEDLVVRALQATRDRSKAETDLALLASLTLDRDGAVDLAELNQPPQVLLSTRLVVVDGRAISFALPLLQQWFGARALLTGSANADEIVRDPRRLDRWRYSFALVAATAGFDPSLNIIQPLIRHAPGLSAWILTEALPEHGFSSNTVGAPPALLSGQRLRTAAGTYIEGLGALAPFIAPVRHDGQPQSVGVGVDGQLVNVCWWCWSDPQPDVVNFNTGDPIDEGWRYCGWRGGSVSGLPNWPWRWVLTEQFAKLKAFLKSPPVLDCWPFDVEARWSFALAVTGKGSLYEGDISTAEVQDAVTRLTAGRDPATAIPLKPGGALYPISLIHRRADEIRAADGASPPWPTRDVAVGGWVWSGYSPQRLAERTAAIYKAALDGYALVVDELFGSFKPYLTTRYLMPATLKGWLKAPEDDGGFEGGPVLTWTLLPERGDSDSRCDIELIPRDVDMFWREETRQLMRSSARQLPSSLMSPVLHNGLLDIFKGSPATELAYGMLSDDLRLLKWTSR